MNTYICSQTLYILILVTRKVLLVESVIPSESISHVWAAKKTAYVSDEENRLFIVGFNGNKRTGKY